MPYLGDSHSAEARRWPWLWTPQAPGGVLEASLEGRRELFREAHRRSDLRGLGKMRAPTAKVGVRPSLRVCGNEDARRPRPKPRGRWTS